MKDVLFLKKNMSNNVIRYEAIMNATRFLVYWKNKIVFLLNHYQRKAY